MSEEVKEVKEVEEKTTSEDTKKVKKDKKFDGKAKADRKPQRREEDGFDKKLVCVRRVTKVVKGGRTLRFSALVVVGNGKNDVGIGIGKSAEVPSAIDKATSVAKKHMEKIRVVNGTIPHEIVGKFASTEILMLPAKPGTGVIAGGAARAVLELSGITDIVTKIHGSTNKINVVKATMNGLANLRTREEIAARRGKSPEEI